MHTTSAKAAAAMSAMAALGAARSASRLVDTAHLDLIVRSLVAEAPDSRADTDGWATGS